MARSSRRESGFQDQLREELKARFPGCMVLKMDQFMGIPDILVLYQDKWALLENKIRANAKRQPGQDYWVDRFNKMSFSRFVYPKNKDDVLNELEQFFTR